MLQSDQHIWKPLDVIGEVRKEEEKKKQLSLHASHLLPSMRVSEDPPDRHNARLAGLKRHNACLIYGVVDPSSNTIGACICRHHHLPLQSVHYIIPELS
ncbi:hypothetical protein GUJ93_ZPchr0012g19412 [Zizania palustris]|uniref:Uncharacterized protein n=1 Tax=Zizania palustris TaxID=103762 RepID=A0A8J6BRN4_ZIZPA|nr:hypothetical protein GUJ93_ZPchr0012g19412 [Zizania palustris]